jgi:hypothetical protein
MSDRIYFNDGARITEEMLNDSFGFLEEASHRLVTSLGVRGIVVGLLVEPQRPLTDMSVVLQPGLAFDVQGQRVAVGAAQTIGVQPSRDDGHLTIRRLGLQRDGVRWGTSWPP